MTSLSYTLNTGAKIPAIGLGTWQSPPGAVAAAVEYAIAEAGVRHVDGAFAYRNEEEVGQGIAKAIASGKVKREDIFVTTKVFTTYHNRVEESINESLQNLGLDYVDLLLIHWPVGLNPNGNHLLLPTRPDGTRDVDPTFSVANTWKQFEQVYASGKARAIGVSNFSVPFLNELLAEAKVVPAVNQIECHPLLPQLEVYELCKEKGILIEAYSPFGSTGGPLFTNKTVVELAEKYKVTPNTILISYHTSAGRVVLPKSVTPSRILDNTTVVELTAEDIKAIDNVHVVEGKKRFGMPPWGVDLKFPDWNAQTLGLKN
jgi:glycerol 2-dehydrogenase (NADP+)